MNTVQIIGAGPAARVCLKPNWKQFVSVEPSSKITRLLEEPTIAADALVAPRKTWEKLNGDNCMARPPEPSPSADVNRFNLNEASIEANGNDMRVTNTALNDSAHQDTANHTDSREDPPKVIKPMHQVCVSGRIELVRFLSSHPNTFRDEVISRMRHFLETRSENLTIDNALIELFQPYGIVECDAQGRCTLRQAHPEGCLGETSKLSWIPQFWQDISQLPNTEDSPTIKNGCLLPIGYSVQGEVVAIDGVGQYWFKPDKFQSAECKTTGCDELGLSRAHVEKVELGGQYLCKLHIYRSTTHYRKLILIWRMHTSYLDSENKAEFAN